MIALASVTLGCGGGGVGPRLAPVSGTVTFDGEPLSDALVSFYHEDDRPANGKTDANGYYELAYMADRPGAIVGENVVRITVATVEGEGVAPKKELIPAMYNVASELTFNVESGSNTNVNFDLKKTGGPG
ncbi:DUF4198 domain-containing protein [Rosistilla ulvae]|uniref:DUF4198 domain-containing protein n=1 Tax=Rosistilla ulvae TaxID=1930277 RepID=UPI001C54DEB7|nr:DUF4198 domain-containing protein [Rosistilla ulvae]